MNTNNVEAIRKLVDNDGISTARLGAGIAETLQQHGDPDHFIEPKEIGRNPNWKGTVTVYGDIQVWADESGTVDRLFFRVAGGLQSVIAEGCDKVKTGLEDCTVDEFKFAISPSVPSITELVEVTQLEVTKNGTEIFAVFLPLVETGPRRLSMLRFNKSEL